MDEQYEDDSDLNPEELTSHPCPQCGCELPDDASDTMGLCTTCYETAYLSIN